MQLVLVTEMFEEENINIKCTYSRAIVPAHTHTSTPSGVRKRLNNGGKRRDRVEEKEQKNELRQAISGINCTIELFPLENFGAKKTNTSVHWTFIKLLPCLVLFHSSFKSVSLSLCFWIFLLLLCCCFPLCSMSIFYFVCRLVRARNVSLVMRNQKPKFKIVFTHILFCLLIWLDSSKWIYFLLRTSCLTHCEWNGESIIWS